LLVCDGADPYQAETNDIRNPVPLLVQSIALRECWYALQRTEFLDDLPYQIKGWLKMGTSEKPTTRFGRETPCSLYS
jgi:hypothetical protein